MTFYSSQKMFLTINQHSYTTKIKNKKNRENYRKLTWRNSDWELANLRDMGISSSKLGHPIFQPKQSSPNHIIIKLSNIKNKENFWFICN